MIRRNNLSLKYAAVFQLLENYDFKICTSPNLRCVLCRRILKDAYQNLCGCRYCYKCIDQFTEVDEKYCPGLSDLCRFVIDRENISSDQATNRKLSSLLAKCPIDDCTYEGQLYFMADHMQSHAEMCPFGRLGCQSADNQAVNINMHLMSENKNHFTLLVDQMEKLHVSVDGMRASLAAYNAINVDNLTTSCMNRNSEIEKLKSEINDLKSVSIALEHSSQSWRAPQVVTAAGVSELRAAIDKQKTINETVESEFRSIFRELQALNDNSSVGSEIRTLDRSISAIKSAVHAKEKSDSDFMATVGAHIKTTRLEGALSVSQSAGCHGDFRRLAQMLEHIEKSIIDYGSTIEGLDEQTTVLESQRGLLEQQMEQGKVPADEVADRLDHIERELPRRHNRKTELAAELASFMEESRVGLDTGSDSTASMQTRLDELFRHTEQLMAHGELLRGLPRRVEWEIEDFRTKFQQAVDGPDRSISSPWFNYVDFQVGFQMYPYGTDVFLGSYLSLLLYISPLSSRETDPISMWITLSIVDQTGGSATFSRRFHYNSVVKQERVVKETSKTDSGNRPLGMLNFLSISALLADENNFIRERCLLIRADFEHSECA